MGSGLGPLRARIVDPSEHIWIADLSSVAIGREGATLLPPDSLQIDRQESDALYESVAELWTGSGFSALPLEPARWRIWLPHDATPTSISPAAASGRPLADWWPTGDAMRAWRRLANEIQMTWHDHPVNTAREARGLPPVNGLWLYGGAKGWRPATPATPWRIIDLLHQPFAQGAWGDWVAALPALSSALEALPAQTQITLLLGEERAVELDTTRSLGWRRLLPGRRDAWKSWWNLPRLTIRKTDEQAAQRLEASGYHPLLSRLWAARGVSRADDVRLPVGRPCCPRTALPSLNMPRACSLTPSATASGC